MTYGQYTIYLFCLAKQHCFFECTILYMAEQSGLGRHPQSMSRRSCQANQPLRQLRWQVLCCQYHGRDYIVGMYCIHRNSHQSRIKEDTSEPSVLAWKIELKRNPRKVSAPSSGSQQGM